LDNVFSFLGQAGSRDFLLNKNHTLDDLFMDDAAADFSKFTKTDTACSDPLGVSFGKKPETRVTADCRVLAKATLDQFRKHHDLTLSLTGNRAPDPLLDAFTALEAFTKELFLAHHSEEEKNILLELIGKSAEGRLTESESAMLHEKLAMVLDDAVSKYTLDNKERADDIREKIKKRHNILFYSAPDLAAEAGSFVNGYFLENHIRRELDAAGRIFSQCLGASPETFPETLASIRIMLGSFAQTKAEKEACREKFFRFSEALLNSDGPMPDAEAVAAYREYGRTLMLEQEFNSSVLPVLGEDLTFVLPELL